MTCMVATYIIAYMSKSFWSQVDAYLFRVLGAALGFAGCAALLINNPPGELLSNIYGIIFFVIFGVLGVYSLGSLVNEVINLSTSADNEG